MWIWGRGRRVKKRSTVIFLPFPVLWLRSPGSRAVNDNAGRRVVPKHAPAKSAWKKNSWGRLLAEIIWELPHPGLFGLEFVTLSRFFSPRRRRFAEADQGRCDPDLRPRRRHPALQRAQRPVRCLLKSRSRKVVTWIWFSLFAWLSLLERIFRVLTFLNLFQLNWVT